MNKPFVCTFFGHRDFNEHCKYEDILEKKLIDFISKNDYIEFLVGRNGEFDIFVASVIHRIKHKHGKDNFSLTLVLPYETAEYIKNQRNYENYYDDIIITEGNCHFKASIDTRNKKMIDMSDVIVCYLIKNEGGAFKASNYAKKCGKNVINIADFKDI